VANLRTEAVSDAAACIRQLNCSQAFVADGYVPCWEAAADAAEPNADTRAFCADQARVWFDCGYWYAVEDCERDYVEFGPEYLDRLAACHTAPSCDELDTCQEEVARTL
jgi:hypothetical protein